MNSRAERHQIPQLPLQQRLDASNVLFDGARGLIEFVQLVELALEGVHRIVEVGAVRYNTLLFLLQDAVDDSVVAGGELRRVR